MGEWDDIGGAEIGHSGPKFNAYHNYLVEVAAVKEKEGHQGRFFIVETVVHESDDPDLPPGTWPSYSGNKKHKQTKGRVLCFAGALFGIDPADEARLRSSISGQHIGMLTGAQQAAKGRFIRISTTEKETEAGYDFVLHNFAPYVGPALPSRLEQPKVMPGNSKKLAQQAAAPAAPPPVTMPGAFVPPAAAPGLPMPAGFPSNGLPAPAGLMGFSSAPAAAPAMPSFPSAPSMPSFPSLPGAGVPQIPQVPGIPGIPGFAAAPPPIPVWPPAGWLVHPQSAAHFYKPGTQIPPKTEPELRALQAQGQA